MKIPLSPRSCKVRDRIEFFSIDSFFSFTDLRYVFHEFANEEDLVEINSDLPDKLLDRLEFRDHLIRTLFDSLLRKYLVQAAAQASKLNSNSPS